jgi:2-methylisocitrate lyase-like PEP mutase family enzyme
MGFDVVFYAVSALFTAVKAVGDTLEELKRTGTPKGREGHMVSYAEFSRVVDLPFHQNWADRFGG